jgi:hypothetical protein
MSSDVGSLHGSRYLNADKGGCGRSNLNRQLG